MMLNDLLNFHCREVIAYLRDYKIPFSLLADTKKVSFTPPLPTGLRKDLSGLRLFFLEGYTFSTIELYEGYITFEAGFGAENFASLVRIGYDIVEQIILTNEKYIEQPIPIFVNLPMPKDFIDSKEPKVTAALRTEISASDELDASLNSILTNPKNAKFRRDTN